MTAPKSNCIVRIACFGEIPIGLWPKIFSVASNNSEYAPDLLFCGLVLLSNCIGQGKRLKRRHSDSRA